MSQYNTINNQNFNYTVSVSIDYLSSFHYSNDKYEKLIKFFDYLLNNKDQVILNDLTQGILKCLDNHKILLGKNLYNYYYNQFEDLLLCSKDDIFLYEKEFEKKDKDIQTESNEFPLDSYIKKYIEIKISEEDLIKFIEEQNNYIELLQIKLDENNLKSKKLRKNIIDLNKKVVSLYIENIELKNTIYKEQNQNV